ncbi:hypothetical protein THIX_60419 [Thiomonas sp. X19]|nr:hypothetical protein THIX_60419 [Thiomonas sp. X19]
MKTIRIFIMTGSVLVSALFFGSAYFIVSHAFTRAIQGNSLRTSRVMAQSTFNSMFQLMSTGWTHAQAEIGFEITPISTHRFVVFRPQRHLSSNWPTHRQAPGHRHRKGLPGRP